MRKRIQRGTLKKSELESFRVRLLQLQSELQTMAENAREASRPVELDQTTVGRLSRMDAMQVQQMAQETARRRQQQIAKIEGALRRIESGEFGECFVCGEALDPRRLEIDPMHALLQVSRGLRPTNITRAYHSLLSFASPTL